MATTTTLVITFLLVSALLVSSSISLPATGVKSWCSRTPHPQTCEYFMTHNPKYTTPIIKSKSDFFKLSSQLALDRCTLAHTTIHALGPKCRNEREKAAWADCVELYEHTIHMINKTVDPQTKCTSSDAQTWLSSALTNLETCKLGFEDFGIADNNYLLLEKLE